MASFLEEINKAAPGKTVRDRGDDASVPGLELRVRKTGAKSFSFNGWIHGKPARITVGPFPDFTVTQARKIVKEWKLQIARGEDPRDKKRGARGELTMGGLWDKIWEKYYEPRGNKWARERKAFWEQYFDKDFRNLPVSRATPALFLDWRDKYVKRPFRANKGLSLLKKMFSWAEERSLVPLGFNPARKVKKFVEPSRDRYATEAELQVIAGVLNGGEFEATATAAIWALLFTGARPQHLWEATWGDLIETERDGETVGLLVRDGKTTWATGDRDPVVFPPVLLEIVKALPRSDDDPRIFQRSETPRPVWRAIRKALKKIRGEDLRARDLRRTFATVALNEGVEKNTVGKLLGHRSAQTTDIYAKLQLRSRLEGSKVAVARLVEITKKPAKPEEGETGE